MTLEEYGALNMGDIIEDVRTGTRKRIMDKYAGEPITQITKEALKGVYGFYRVLVKVGTKFNESDRKSPSL